MIGSPAMRHQEFSSKLAEILHAIKYKQDASLIADLIDEASLLLVKDEPLHIDEVLNELKMDYHATLLALAKYPSGGLLLSAMAEWQNDKKIQEPIAYPSSSNEVIKEEPLPAKGYIARDNAELHKILSSEFEGQEVKNAKSTYAWKYKTGQLNVLKQQPLNALNIFFLGTSTPPLFGKHNIDVCETGHIISQASLQTGLKGEPTLLVKGIATIDMAPTFPLDALQNPSINGVSSGGYIETFRKTKTTVKGVGVESRLQLTVDEFFVPNLLRMLGAAPLDERQELTVNLAGHSRGGITTFIMADCADQFIQTIMKGEEGKDYNIDELALSSGMGKAAVSKVIADIKANGNKIKIHVCALDPVEGARSMTGWDPFGDYIPKFEVPVKGLAKPISCSYVNMAPSVNEITVLFAADERRSGFKPTIPNTAEGTKLRFIREPGKHGTLTGNYGNDGGAGQFAYPTFANDIVLQDAMLGIFDHSLIELNKAMHPNVALPEFPLNTFRRIITQPDYVNTYNLLKRAVSAQLGSDAWNNAKSDEERIGLFQKVMVENPQDNVVLYDSLSRDAQRLIEKHKEKLLLLKKEWQHDTNISESVDRDPWFEDRSVFIRGKKVKGTVMWKQNALATLAPVYLPDSMYYGRNTQPIEYQFKHDKRDQLILAFYHYKNKIAAVASTHKMSKDQKRAAILGDDYANLNLMLKEAIAAPDTKSLAVDMLHELMIDVDYKYQIMTANDFSAQCQQTIEDPVLHELAGLCLATQLESIDDYINTLGCHQLATEEAVKLIEQIGILLPQIEKKHQDIWLDLQQKLQVMTELDQYIVALSVYSESKPKTTYQNTNEVDAFVKQLQSLRSDMNHMSASDARAVLKEKLDTYCKNKGFQGLVSKWVKSNPASVGVIQQTMENIQNADILKEVKRFESIEAEKVTAADLDHYIKGLEAYVKSYRSPKQSSVNLLTDLKAIQALFDQYGPDKSAYDLRKLLKDYCKNNQEYQNTSYLSFNKDRVKYDNGMLGEIDRLTQSLQAQKMKDAKERLQIAMPVNKS